jgi:hypothetical protein
MTRQYQVNLPSNAVTYNLLTLIKLDAQVTADPDWPVPDQCCEISLQASGGILTVTKPVGTVGIVINNGNGYTWRTRANSLACSDLNLRGDTNGMNVNATITSL